MGFSAYFTDATCPYCSAAYKNIKKEALDDQMDTIFVYKTCQCCNHSWMDEFRLLTSTQEGSIAKIHDNDFLLEALAVEMLARQLDTTMLERITQSALQLQKENQGGTPCK